MPGFGGSRKLLEFLSGAARIERQVQLQHDRLGILRLELVGILLDAVDQALAGPAGFTRA
jgi:hypothetical protein